MNRGTLRHVIPEAIEIKGKLLAANCGTLRHVIPETIEIKGKLLAAFCDKPRRRYTPLKGGCTGTMTLHTTSVIPTSR